jgi:hypothetical protein
VLVCVKQVQEYKQARYGRQKDGETMTIAEAARELGQTIGGMRSTVRREGMTTIPELSFYGGDARLPRQGNRLRRSEVIALREKRRQAPTRLCEHRDERTNELYLPSPLVEDLYHFGQMDLYEHSRVKKSSWYLDGRAKDNDPYPPPEQRRLLRFKILPNRGRGQKRVFVYHDGDLQIMHGRKIGSLTAEQARDQARALLSSPGNTAAGETAPAAEPKTPPIQEVKTPRWDEMTSTLFWGDSAIRQFRKHPAQNQRELIEAFHRRRWEQTIPNPFGTDARKLEKTIYSLNQSLTQNFIQFAGDGTGEGAMWLPCDNAL